MKFIEVVTSFEKIAKHKGFKLLPATPLVSDYPWNEGNFTLSPGLEHIIPVLEGSSMIEDHKLAFRGSALRNLDIGKIGYSPFHVLLLQMGVITILDTDYEEQNLLQLLEFTFEWLYSELHLKRENSIYTVWGETRMLNGQRIKDTKEFLSPLRKMGVSPQQIIITKGRRNFVFSRGALRPAGFSIEIFYPLNFLMVC